MISASRVGELIMVGELPEEAARDIMRKLNPMMARRFLNAVIKEADEEFGITMECDHDE